MQLTSILATLLPFAAVANASPLEARDAATCTTTITKVPTKIGIVVQSLVTSTSSIDCHGCDLVITTEDGGAATTLGNGVERRGVTATVWDTVCATSTAV